MLKSDGNGEVDTTALHVIPCSLDYTGEAQVEDYFFVSQEGHAPLVSSFRGRRLEGKIINVPQSLNGLVIQSSSVISGFVKVAQWYADSLSSEDNNFECMMEMVDSYSSLLS